MKSLAAANKIIKAIAILGCLSTQLHSVAADAQCKLVTKVENDTKELKCQVGVRMLSIHNESKKFKKKLKKKKFVDGDLLKISGASIVDDSIVIPSDATFKMIFRKRATPIARKASGVKKVLALYIVAPDVSTEGVMRGVANSLEDDIFGTYGDTYNLRSQYDACSFGQIDMTPAELTTTTGVSITGGVHQITISAEIKTNKEETITNLVLDEAEKELGDLESQFDHVMVCVPLGTTDGGNNFWAYAYINSWLSVYGDKECHYLATIVHEIGHNLGLHHSGQGTNQYADEIGQMGYSNSWDDTGILRKCFNGPKTWTLGWIEDRHVTLKWPQNFNFEGDLYGIMNYEETTSDNKMIIMLKSPDNTQNVYISYNLATGLHDETDSAINKVAIHWQNDQQTSPKSWLMASLAAGQSYTASVREFQVPIKVVSIGGNPKRATLKIGIESEPTTAPTTPLPTTPLPTPPPTSSPTNLPGTPTASPVTVSPVSNPTPAPTIVQSPVTPTPTTGESLNRFAIKSKLGDYCLEPIDSDLTPIILVQLRPCNKENDSQHWIGSPSGQYKNYADPSLCLLRGQKKDLRAGDCLSGASSYTSRTLLYDVFNERVHFGNDGRFLLTVPGGVYDPSAKITFEMDGSVSSLGQTWSFISYYSSSSIRTFAVSPFAIVSELDKCVFPTDVASNKLIRAGACVNNSAKTFSKQQWEMDEYNQIQNGADETLCMRAKRNLSESVTLLKLTPCVIGEPSGVLTQFVWDPFMNVWAWKKDMTTVLTYDNFSSNPLQISNVQLDSEGVVSGQRWYLEG